MGPNQARNPGKLGGATKSFFSFCSDGDGDGDDDDDEHRDANDDEQREAEREWMDGWMDGWELGLFWLWREGRRRRDQESRVEGKEGERERRKHRLFCVLLFSFFFSFLFF